MPEAGADDGGQLLARLRLDQRQCWQRGQRVLVETYLQQHPTLTADEGQLLDLLYGEVLLREELGEQPSLAEYLQRFPQLGDQLRRQFLVHRALASASYAEADDPAGAACTPAPPLTPAGHDGLAAGRPERSRDEPLRGPPPPDLDVLGYQVLGELGRGGMGVVYKARQLSLNRVVALKMILAGPQTGPQEVARFRAEAEAVATLQHPNVVQIYEVGLHEGRPYLALEFVDGVSLAQHVRGAPQPPAPAARMVATLACAVHAGHQQGIVHRDLKPGNVLLARSARGTAAGSWAAARAAGHEADELARFEPKITDFGLAKRLESDSHLTQTGDILGTPSYMAPEQASGSSHLVGPQVDVYALGAILYEMLTGRPPFRGATALDTLQQVQLEEPVAPRRLQPKVPRDLETICLKCLQKTPAKRYPTAESLALDLDRFVAGESIEARRVSAWERSWKWAKRRPAAAALVAVSLAAAVTLLVVWVRFTSRLQFERDTARHERTEAIRQKASADFQRDRAEQHLYDSQINLAQQAWRGAYIPRLVQLLETQAPARGQRDRRGPEWYYLWRLAHSARQTLRGHIRFARHLAFSPDGRLLATAGDDEVVKVWDTGTGDERAPLDGHASYVSAVAFSPDSRQLASAGGDHTVRIWDTANGTPVRTLRGHTAPVCSVAFSPSGRQIASASRDRTVAIWEVAGGRPIFVLRGHRAAVMSVAYLAGGQQLLSGSEDQTVRIWDLQTYQVVHILDAAARVPSVASSPDDTHVAAGCDDNLIRLWNVATGQAAAVLRGHTGPVSGVAFGAAGRLLASSSWDRTVRLWDVPSGRQQRTLRGHAGLVLAVAFHPDGQRLASAGDEIKIWNALEDQESRPLGGHSQCVHSVAFSPDTKSLATAGQDGTVRIWDTATGDQQVVLDEHQSPVLSVRFSPDGQHLASASQDRTVKIWPLRGRDQPVTLKGHTGMVHGVAFSPDGRFLASASQDHTIRIWDRTRGTARWVLRGHATFVYTVSFSPDSRFLAAGDRNGAIEIWDTASGRLSRNLAGHDASVRSVAYSDTGNRLASAGDDRLVKLWDTTSGALAGVLRGHTDLVNQVAFAGGDRRRLVSCSGSGLQPGEVKLWNVTTRQELLTLRGHATKVTCVAISRDHQHWASADGDGTVRIWDAPRSGQP